LNVTDVFGNGGGGFFLIDEVISKGFDEGVGNGVHDERSFFFIGTIVAHFLFGGQ
jgi:hypothetical protein